MCMHNPAAKPLRHILKSSLAVRNDDNVSSAVTTAENVEIILSYIASISMYNRLTPTAMTRYLQKK